MKILKIAACVLTAACLTTSAHAATRVLVMPYVDMTGEVTGIEKDLTDAAAAEVKKSAAYTCVSPEEFAANWMKAVQAGGKGPSGPDAEQRMKDLRQFRGLFGHDDLGTISEYRDLWGVDLVVIGDVRRVGGALKVSSEIIGMNTGRFYAVSGDATPGRITEEVVRQVGELLAKGDAVRQMAADRRLDEVMSVVAYDMRTMEGEDLLMVTDYTGRRPDPELQDMDIAPARPIREGVKILRLATDKERPIEFQYHYKDGERMSVNIAVDPPAGAGEGDIQEVLNVRSKGGHVVAFTFYWQNGQLKGVRAEPAVNPFGEVS